MLIYQSKAKLDEKILFGRITRQLDPEIRKMPVKGMFGNKDSSFHSGPCFYLLLKLKFFFWNFECELQCHINYGQEWNVEF